MNQQLSTNSKLLLKGGDFIKNKYNHIVHDKTIDLLMLWIERRSTNNLKAAFTPQEKEKHICHKFYDNNGELKLHFDKITGVELPTTSNTQKDNWNNIDEMGMIFFDLSEFDRKVIISFLNPYKQINKKNFKTFLNELKIYKRKRYEKFLETALLRLQLLSEYKGVTKRMLGRNDNELNGWSSIADYLGVSEVTAIKWASDPELMMPVVQLGKGKSVFALKEHLQQWVDEYLRKNFLYSNINKKKSYGKKKENITEGENE